MGSPCRASGSFGPDRALGAARLLVNHGHEAMYGAPELDVPVFVGEKDRAELARGLPVAGTFTERCMIDDDLEVIPTPGHTPGATSYLWNSGTHRFLFTGDSLVVERGEWKAVVLGSSDRAASLESLGRLRGLDFDVLVPWVALEGENPVDVVDRTEARRRIDAVVDRVGAGGPSRVGSPTTRPAVKRRGLTVALGALLELLDRTPNNSNEKRHCAWHTRPR